MTAKDGNDAHDHGQTQILRDFLAWFDQRTAEGPIIDLRLVKNQTARVAVNRIMGVIDDE